MVESLKNKRKLENVSFIAFIKKKKLGSMLLLLDFENIVPPPPTIHLRILVRKGTTG